MDLKSVVDRMFDFLEQIRLLLEGRDVRWLTLLITVFFAVIFMAVGMPGIALLMVGVYIMYFVTFR